MFIRSLTSSLLVCGLLCADSATASQKTYIVHLASGNDGATGGLVRRQNLQAELAIAPATVLYNYGTVLDGFAAKLTDEQVSNLKAHPDVMSVTEDIALQLHTTHTPSFLGLAQSNGILGQRDVEYAGMPLGKREVSAGEADIIIGVLDTGAWPENPSYSDHGLPAIPAHWKGNCDEGERWTKANCNKKLIGAAYFYKGFLAAQLQQNATFNASSILKSARDEEGHGTHTSTTIAGSRTANVSLFGQAAGNARGMAPDARLAIYKVCWSDGCYNSDLLAAIERAIADGVNVISASLGGGNDFGGENDILSPSTFAAAQKGIFSSFSAGNAGPDLGTASNLAPWMLTVAASTLDREFPATVSLGNGLKYTGQSLYSNGSVSDIQPLSSNTVLPLILGSAAAVPNGNVTAAQLCKPDTLDPARVAGKIVVCTRGDNARVNKGAVVKKAGGRGMVLVNNQASGEEVIADAHVLPAVGLGVKAGAPVLEYAKSSSATASLQFVGTRLGVPAPKMAAFSSRGPNVPVPQLLKPDITGPGVSIIAGWTRAASPTDGDDPRRVDYNVISGTSMSCPHLSGIVAYIMARRPGWSPAAVRSAIMTTAYTHAKGASTPIIDTADSTDAKPFAYGNGHVDPVAALNPGLIYNMTTKDYQEFVCSVDKSQAFMSQATGTHFACDKNKVYSPYDLNYPSYSAWYNTNTTTGTYNATFHRTLTSVGGAGTYKASLTFDHEYVNVVVKPDQLTFKAAGDTQTFEVIVTMKARSTDELLTDEGRLVWFDGTHTVGSSLAFLWADIQ